MQILKFNATDMLFTSNGIIKALNYLMQCKIYKTSRNIQKETLDSNEYMYCNSQDNF